MSKDQTCILELNSQIDKLEHTVNVMADQIKKVIKAEGTIYNNSILSCDQ